SGSPTSPRWGRWNRFVLRAFAPPSSRRVPRLATIGPASAPPPQIGPSTRKNRGGKPVMGAPVRLALAPKPGGRRDCWCRRRKRNPRAPPPAFFARARSEARPPHVGGGGR